MDVIKKDIIAVDNDTDFDYNNHLNKSSINMVKSQKNHVLETSASFKIQSALTKKIYY